MPGKHAPKSPRSYYLSLGRAAAGVAGAIALVVVLAVVAFGNRGTKTAAPPPSSSPSATPSVSSPPLDSSTPTPTPTPTVRAPSTITVSILNGTSRGGLASRTRPQIAAAGYKVIRVGNASNAAKSTIFYAPGYAAEASALQRRFPAFTVIKPADSSVPGGVNLTLVLGSDYPS